MVNSRLVGALLTFGQIQSSLSFTPGTGTILTFHNQPSPELSAPNGNGPDLSIWPLNVPPLPENAQTPSNGPPNNNNYVSPIFEFNPPNMPPPPPPGSLPENKPIPPLPMPPKPTPSTLPDNKPPQPLPMPPMPNLPNLPNTNTMPPPSATSVSGVDANLPPPPPPPLPPTNTYSNGIPILPADSNGNALPDYYSNGAAPGSVPPLPGQNMPPPLPPNGGTVPGLPANGGNMYNGYNSNMQPGLGPDVAGYGNNIPPVPPATNGQYGYGVGGNYNSMPPPSAISVSGVDANIGPPPPPIPPLNTYSNGIPVLPALDANGNPIIDYSNGVPPGSVPPLPGQNIPPLPASNGGTVPGLPANGASPGSIPAVPGQNVPPNGGANVPGLPGTNGVTVGNAGNTVPDVAGNGGNVNGAGNPVINNGAAAAAKNDGRVSLVDGMQKSGSFEDKFNMAVPLGTQAQILVAMLMAICFGCITLKWCFCGKNKDANGGNAEYMSSSNRGVQGDADWSDNTEDEENDIYHGGKSKKSKEQVADDSVDEEDAQNRLEINQNDIKIVMDHRVHRNQQRVDDETDEETKAIMREFKDSDDEYID